VPNSPEKDIEVFLSALPARKRKEFQLGLNSLTEDELRERNDVEQFDDNGLTEEYRRLLQRIPARWAEYQERNRNQFGHVFFPGNPSGRPRKDDLAIEAEALRKNGLSWTQIAINLNARHGERITSRDGIRKLVKSRESKAGNTRQSPENT
jgi:hypothetical protein